MMSDTQNKTVIFIEPYGSSLSLIDHGLTLGYKIIIFTANADMRIVSDQVKMRVHQCIVVDTASDDACYKAVDRLKAMTAIHAVIPGFEYFVPIAVKLSRYLDLPGNLLEDADLLRNKAKMRTKLMMDGIRVPSFSVITSIADLHEAINTISFPAVCKPVDAAGSVNVRKVTNKREAFLAASRILHVKDILWGYTLSNALLYEAYISGKEYSLEGVIINGHIHHLNITEKIVSDEIDFVEVGHIVNSPLSQELKVKLRAYIETVIKSLSANNCPFHAEIRIDNNGLPVLMEVAARLAGDKIADLIKLTGKLNYFDAVYSAYFGIPLEVNLEQDEFAGIRFFYRPTLSVYTSVTKTTDLSLLAEEVCLYYQPNQPIPAFPKALRRLGHIIMKSNDYAQLKLMLASADQSVVFHE